MPQTTVTRQYNIRKRAQPVDPVKQTKDVLKGTKSKEMVETSKESLKANEIAKISKGSTGSPKSQKALSSSLGKKKNPPKKEKKQGAVAANKTKVQSTLKSFFKGEEDTTKAKVAKKANCFSCVNQQRISSPFQMVVTSDSLQQTRKRTLNNLDETIVSKNRHSEEKLVQEETLHKSLIFNFEEATRKLEFDSNSSINTLSPELQVKSQIGENSEALKVLGMKLKSSSHIGELKEALQSFNGKISKLKKLQSNPFMINCIASSAKSEQKKKPLPAVFACNRFRYLTQTDPLVLPAKYKELSEIFSMVDTLVAQTHNAQKKVTFDKLMKEVHAAGKRNFTEVHLGQILSVFPVAYNLSVEKTSHTCKENAPQNYQLTLTPTMISVQGTKKMPAAFKLISQSDLTYRTNTFDTNLLELVKNHHQEFLHRIKFGPVSKESVIRWHPKFPVDSVPDIPATPLPETELSIAKDVHGKVETSFHSKPGKFLQSVNRQATTSEARTELYNWNCSKPPTAAELKAICLDILVKIRGKDSAKKLNAAVPEESPELFEKIPKLVNIIYYYFIAERKSAIHLEAVVEKINQSLSSLANIDQVKGESVYIREKFPFWLNFVGTSTGLYITLNKSTNVAAMLHNAGIH